jgi:hypothetical protein
MRRPLFTPHEGSWYSFLLEAELTPGAAGRIGKLKKKYSDLIGNRTRDLPACSIVPQPTTLPRAKLNKYEVYEQYGPCLILYYLASSSQ